MAASADRLRRPRAGERRDPPPALRVLLPVRDAGAVVVATHPGVLPSASYRVIAEALAPEIELGVLELASIPEYRHSACSGDPLDLVMADVAQRFAPPLREYVAGRPYVLLGWSFGGVIGCALTEAMTRDAQPALLLLLDSIAPGPGDPGRQFGAAIPEIAGLYWFAMYFGVMRGVSLGFSVDDLARHGVAASLSLILERCVSRGALPSDTSVAAVRKVFDAFMEGMLRNKQLQDSFEPHPPRCPVSLLRPARSLVEDSPTLGWGALIGPSLDVRRCTGDHYTMLGDAEPAERISELVGRALAMKTAACCP